MGEGGGSWLNVDSRPTLKLGWSGIIILNKPGLGTVPPRTFRDRSVRKCDLPQVWSPTSPGLCRLGAPSRWRAEDSAGVDWRSGGADDHGHSWTNTVERVWWDARHDGSRDWKGSGFAPRTPFWGAGGGGSTAHLPVATQRRLLLPNVQAWQRLAKRTRQA